MNGVNGCALLPVISRHSKGIQALGCAHLRVRKGVHRMDFFNDLGKKFSNMARSVSEKTKESVETTRISGDLRGAKSQLEQLYAEYGKACYDIHMGAGNPAVADKLCESIQALLARIEKLNAQRDELKAIRRCPNCGSVQSREARFCANCGKRMPEDAPRPEPEDAEAGHEFCVECGAMMEPGSRFCTVCGKDYGDDGDAPAAEEASAPKVEEADAEEPDLTEETHQQ